eukprot:Platyproteum_vivax@DN2168_c0_g1_i1.p1
MSKCCPCLPNWVVAFLSCLVPLIYAGFFILLAAFDSSIMFIVFCATWGTFTAAAGIAGIVGVFKRQLGLIRFCYYVQLLMNVLVGSVAVMLLSDLTLHVGFILRRHEVEKEAWPYFLACGLTMLFVVILSTWGLWAAADYSMEIEVDQFALQEQEKEIYIDLQADYTNPHTKQAEEVVVLNPEGSSYGPNMLYGANYGENTPLLN